MKMKKALMIILIVLAVLSCLTVVSSAPASAGKLLSDSSVTVYYSEPQVSTDYAYYYENSGNYAEEAYYAPWSVDATVELDVNAMYNRLSPENASYKLADFKEDLATIVDNGQIGISNLMISGVNAKDVNETEVTASLDENSSVLTVSFNYSPDDPYATKSKATSTMNSLEHAKTAQITVKISDLDGIEVKNPKLAKQSFGVSPKVKTETAE